MPDPERPLRTRDSAPGIGRRIEAAALQHLRGAGLTLLAQNYRCRIGEIDLIMRDENQIVFIEVRYRRSIRFGSAAESIVRTKRRKIVMTAQHYLQTHAEQRALPARFDVMAISPLAQGLHMDWIRNAFQD